LKNGKKTKTWKISKPVTDLSPGVYAAGRIFSRAPFLFKKEKVPGEAPKENTRFLLLTRLTFLLFAKEEKYGF